ncbi:sensor histidine kinase [Ahrensia marina]|uniref:histidine kinase n=1 Tax=Ahrensia marina TaxID=1514904 RepID=A0A0M9GNK7_9HYPH|nr:sensor histidine kinase [Ahrensia marina]KPB02107.1 histidine kinase [Ahrensia marina]
MSVDTDHIQTVKKRSGARPLRRFFAPILRPMRRIFGHLFFSSITRRILILNLAALALLMSGILYLNQFRDGLIDARVESLMTQGEIISGAIAASASVETNAILIDPEKLLELEAGESIVPKVDGLDNLDFPINPERVAPVLRRLISPTRTRARIYDRDANLILDSRHLYSRGQILRYELDPIDMPELSLFDRVKNYFENFFVRRDLPVYREQPGGTGALYPEVMGALTGGRSQIVRVSEQGEMIVSVAVPVQRFRAVLGVLQLSTQGGDIDKIVAAERTAMFRVFVVAVMVNIILSMLLASTIANPLRRLSAGAVRVRKSIKAREEIPDFSDRQDEIGNLSVALRDMTQSLYGRIDAIESFAADVSHELKNPLTSLRSAVETLPMVKNDAMRDRLLDVIEHDVRRLDRLITDISNASRLDAELVREDAQPVDLEQLLKNMVSIFDQGHLGEMNVDLKIAKLPTGTDSYTVPGNESRLGQVITNLIENARSFIPEVGGEIRVFLTHKKDHIEVRVEDNGPGIRAENTETIFKRFYTDRPGADEFGKNSGLGLSISRQIAEAHGGTLIAENIQPDTGKDGTAGARFILCLPCE